MKKDERRKRTERKKERKSRNKQDKRSKRIDKRADRRNQQTKTKNTNKPKMQTPSIVKWVLGAVTTNIHHELYHQRT